MGPPFFLAFHTIGGYGGPSIANPQRFTFSTQLVPFLQGPGGTPCCSFVISTAATGADWQNIDKNQVIPNFTEPHVCCKMPMFFFYVKYKYKSRRSTTQWAMWKSNQTISDSCNILPQLKISIGLFWSTDLFLLCLLRLLEAAENWAREMLARNWCHFSDGDVLEHFKGSQSLTEIRKTSWLHLCIL